MTNPYYNMVPLIEMPNFQALESSPPSQNGWSGSLSLFFQVPEMGPIGARHTYITSGDGKTRAAANPDDLVPDNTTDKSHSDGPLQVASSHKNAMTTATIETDKMVGDIFTKPLDKTKFLRFRKAMLGY